MNDLTPSEWQATVQGLAHPQSMISGFVAGALSQTPPTGGVLARQIITEQGTLRALLLNLATAGTTASTVGTTSIIARVNGATVDSSGGTPINAAVLRGAGADQQVRVGLGFDVSPGDVVDIILDTQVSNATDLTAGVEAIRRFE